MVNRARCGSEAEQSTAALSPADCPTLGLVDAAVSAADDDDDARMKLCCNSSLSTVLAQPQHHDAHVDCTTIGNVSLHTQTDRQRDRQRPHTFRGVRKGAQGSYPQWLPDSPQLTIL